MPLNVWTPPKPKRSYLYLPDGWDDAWKAAKATIATTPAWMTAFGDSITAGFVASDVINKGWFGLVRASLSAKYPTAYGDFYSCAESFDFTQFSFGTTNPSWVVNTTAGRTWQRYDCGAVPTWTGTPANAITFTTPYACTDMDIFYHDYSPVTGAWTYSVDGGGAVTVTPVGNNYLMRIQLTGLANTTHTINFSQTVAGLNLMPFGVAVYKSRTAGLGYAKFGLYGKSLIDNGQVGWLYPLPDNFVALQGKGAAATGLGFPMQAPLWIFGMNINDNGKQQELFADSYRRACNAARRGYPNCSILFLINCHPSATSSDLTSAWFPNDETWHATVRTIYQTARMYNAAVVNINAKWGETPVTQGFMTQGQPHPNDAGHQDIANVLLSIL